MLATWVKTLYSSLELSSSRIKLAFGTSLFPSCTELGRRFLQLYHLAAQEDLKRFPLLLWWYADWCCNKVTFVQVHWTLLCKCSLLQDKAMTACLCSNNCFLFVWKFSSENSTSYWSRCPGALFFVLWSTDSKSKTPSVCVVFPC